MEAIKTICPKCGYDFEVKLFSSQDIQIYSVSCRSCKEKFKINLNGEPIKEIESDFNLPTEPFDYGLPPPKDTYGPPHPNDYRLPPPEEPYGQPPWVKPKKEKSTMLPVAGLLLIIVFILGTIFGAFTFIVGEELFEGFGSSGKISGNVVDENGSPIVDAKVEVVGEGEYDFTDTSGKYELTNVPGGYQKIRALKDNKTSVYTWVLMIGNEENIDFTLKNGTGEIEKSSSVNKGYFKTTIYVCGIISIVGSIFALVGGIFAIMQKNYNLAFIGALFGIASIGFVFGTILSIIALIMIWKSKDSFN